MNIQPDFQLITHPSTNKGPKNYFCAYCGEKHDTVGARDFHEKENHCDEEGNFLEITCDLCKQTLSTGNDFRKHTKQVHKKKTYVLAKYRDTAHCEECGKIFKIKFKFIINFKGSTILKLVFI